MARGKGLPRYATLEPPRVDALKPGAEWTCADCSWSYRVPEVGCYGRRTGWARFGQVKNAYVHHKCEKHTRG